MFRKKTIFDSVNLVNEKDLSERMGAYYVFDDETLQQKLELFRYEPYVKVKNLQPIKETHKRTGFPEPINSIVNMARNSFFSNYRYDAFASEVVGQDPVDKDREITYPFTYYRSRKDVGTRPLVIVVPTLFGISPMELNIADNAARNGTNCFIAKPPERAMDMRRPLIDLIRYQTRVVTGIRNLIDYAGTLPEINTDRIVIFGMSLGGGFAALTLGIESRIKAGAVFVAGGNYPDLWTSTQNVFMRNYIDFRMREEGFRSRKDLKRYFIETVQADPIHFARRRSPEDIFMLVSGRDSDVPTRNQVELWQAWGRPQHDYVSTKHLGSVFRYHFYQEALYRFLRDRIFALEEQTVSERGAPQVTAT